MEYTTFFSEAAARIEDAAFWLDSHGISIDTARRLRVGYDAEQATGPSLIVPTTEESFIAVNLADDSAVIVGNQRPFCSCAIDNSRRPVFVVEDVLSALAIIEAGGEACAVCGMDSARALLEDAMGGHNPARLLLAVDATGKLSALLQTLSERLSVVGVACMPVNVLCGQMNASAALAADREAFAKKLRETETQALGAPDGVESYIRFAMGLDAARFAKASAIKTGFRRLDDLTGGLYPGLYVVGALSSLGKSSFVLQLSDQVAASGAHVLFFSLEMSRLELASKSLARQAALALSTDIYNAPTSLEIRRGEGKEFAAWAVEEYTANVGNRLSIIEGSFKTDVNAITAYVGQYVERNHVRPCVVVDYLQVMQNANKASTLREAVDYNLVELKRLSRAYSVPVIVVSSVNRNNYTMPIDFESFKESGGIEYTADVVFGLQFACIHEDVFAEDNKKTVAKRDRIREAAKQEPRGIELVCLKNRYGSRSWSVYFDYYAAHDWFLEKDAPPVSALDDLKKRVNGKR